MSCSGRQCICDFGWHQSSSRRSSLRGIAPTSSENEVDLPQDDLLFPVVPAIEMVSEGVKGLSVLRVRLMTNILFLGISMCILERVMMPRKSIAIMSQANRNEGRMKVGISVEDIVMSVAQTPLCFQSERDLKAAV